jgi:hypothetical protein
MSVVNLYKDVLQAPFLKAESKIRHTPFPEVWSLLLSFATDGNWPTWAVTTPKAIFEEAAVQTRRLYWRAWVFLRGRHFRPLNSFSPDVEGR